MTTTVGTVRRAIKELIKEELLTDGCRINEHSWRIIQDRIAKIDTEKKTGLKLKNPIYVGAPQ